ASTSRSVTILRKSSTARACMRAGISSENSSNRRSGMGLLCSTLPWRGRVGAHSAPGWGDGGTSRHGRRVASMLQRPSLCRGRSVDGGIDRLQHAVHVPGEIVIPKTHHPIAFALRPARARIIALADVVVPMLRAVDFDD